MRNVPQSKLTALHVGVRLKNINGCPTLDIQCWTDA